MSVRLLLASPVLCPRPRPSTVQPRSQRRQHQHVQTSRGDHAQQVPGITGGVTDSTLLTSIADRAPSPGGCGWSVARMSARCSKWRRSIRCIYNLHPDPARAGPSSQLGRHSNILLSESKKSGVMRLCNTPDPMSGFHAPSGQALLNGYDFLLTSLTKSNTSIQFMQIATFLTLVAS